MTGRIAYLLIPLLLFFLAPYGALAGGLSGGGGGNEDPAAPYDEIYIYMNVQGVGIIQIPAAIRNEAAYLSVTDLFDYLKIQNTPAPGLDSISGFFINPDAPYLIDKKNNQIRFKNKVYTLAPDDMIKTETNLYLRVDALGQIFGLTCKFSFRSLSILLTTQLELPIVREMRQEQMRNNLRHLRGETVADTIIRRQYPLFRIGMADWAFVTTQYNPGYNDNRAYLGLGGVLAGGETNVILNYDNAIPFREREQFYQWRLVDNDNPSLRQVTAGKLYTGATSTLYYPVVGLQFSNTPTTYRRAFGTYAYSNYTQPGWIVELYVNNELVDYTKADASGFFSFKVPLVYGASAVKFRYYGPWGEERASIGQNFQIPYTFLPSHEFEYTTSAGMEEDSLHSRFARGCANYGINGRLTVGAGVEYLSSVYSSPVMPFVNASYRVNSHLFFAANFTYGVRASIIGDLQLPRDVQLEASYIKYKEGQQSINVTYLEERKAVLSVPIRKKHFSAFSRSTFYQVVLPGNIKYTTLEELISGSIFGINTNFTTYALYNPPFPNYIYSDLSLIFRLPGKLIFNPRVQYEYDDNRIFDYRGEIGKYVLRHGYFNTFYEKNNKVGFYNIGVGFRYEFPFALGGGSFLRANGVNTTVQSASGSLAYDDQLHHMGYSNRSNVGRGGFVILPYLDLNSNGKWDPNEPKVKGIRVQVNQGRVQYSKDGTIIRVSELESYTSYTVRLQTDFENISWHLKDQTLDIVIDPNQFKVIELPVTVQGEVAGTVYLKEDQRTRPLGRVIVAFYNVEDRSLAARTMTEADGSFDYTGLPPGRYVASIPGAQLYKLHMDAQPINIPFTITENKDGDFINGLEFILTPLPGKAPAPTPDDNNPPPSPAASFQTLPNNPAPIIATAPLPNP
jgi:hypothetical protein